MGECTCQNCHCGDDCQCEKPSTKDKLKTKMDHGLMAVGLKKDTRPEKPSDAAWDTMEQAERNMQRLEDDELRAGQRVQQDAAQESHSKGRRDRLSGGSRCTHCHGAASRGSAHSRS